MEFLTNLIPSESDGVPFACLNFCALGNETIGLIPQLFLCHILRFEYSCLNWWMRFWLFLGVEVVCLAGPGAWIVGDRLGIRRVGGLCL
jgi:hypothetical protein